MPEPVPSTAELAAEAVQDLVLHPMEALVRVAQAPAHAAAVVGQTLDGLRSIVGMGNPPQGPFDIRVGPNRRFATAEAPFELVHGVKRALSGTINDVVLAAVGGGLHDLLDARGEPTRGRVLRVMVPVSVRSKAEQGDVGNRVAPAFVDIPVGQMKPATRLKRVRAATAALKGSAMAVSADSIIGLGAYAPPALHAMAARLASRNRWFNLVVSNIPAPQVPMYLAGARLVASYPAMPLGENCALVHRVHQPRRNHGVRTNRRLGRAAGHRCARSRHRAIPERAVRCPFDDQAAAFLAHDLGIPVGDLCQPATGCFHLRRMTDAGEDASPPGWVSSQNGFGEGSRHESIPPAVQQENGADDGAQSSRRYVGSFPQSEHRSRGVEERVRRVRIALPFPDEVHAHPHDLVGDR